MIKRNLTKVLLLSGVLLTGNLASAYDFEAGGISYRLVSVKEKTCAVIQGNAAYPDVTVIPDTVEDKGTKFTVVGIAANAFDLTTGLTTITLPATLKYIENAAFFKTTKLKTVNATGLVPADISASPFATAVYTNATLNVPEGCWLAYQQSWSRFAIVNEPGFYTVNVDGYNWGIFSVKDKYARLMSRTAKFSGDFTVPATVTSRGVEYKVVEIGRNCFDGCGELTSVTMPEGLLAINDYAFRKCNKLTTVKVPESVVYFAQGMFNQCALLEKVDLSSKTTRVENITFQKCPKLNEVILPAGVEYVGASCFSDCPELTEVKNADKLKVIMSGAFKNTPKLNLVLPTGLTTLENSSFTGSGVTIGEWPAKIDAVLASTFQNCNNLKNVVLPKKLRLIGSSAFNGCKSLESITMPDSVDEPLGSMAFSNCSALKKFKFPRNIKVIPMNFLMNDTSLVEMDIPDCVEELHNYAISGLYNIPEIKLPKNLKKIAQGAMRYNRKIKTIEFPEGVELIGGMVLQGCTSLETAKLSNKIELLNSFTFRDCNSLKRVECIDSITTLANDAFENCTSLEEFTVPKKVKAIWAKAFLGCSSLKKITLPEGLDSIAKNAFQNCSTMNQIIFPASLQYIKDEAFKGCSGFGSVIVKGSTPAELVDNAFDAATYEKASLIVIPENALDAYSKADGWKNFKTRTTGVDGIETEPETPVYGKVGEIEAPDNARVFNLSGIETGKTGLERGIYIVVCGHRRYKVVVK